MKKIKVALNIWWTIALKSVVTPVLLRACNRGVRPPRSARRVGLTRDMLFLSHCHYTSVPAKLQRAMPPCIFIGVIVSYHIVPTLDLGHPYSTSRTPYNPVSYTHAS